MLCPGLGALACSRAEVFAGPAEPVNARQTCREWRRSTAGGRRSAVQGLRGALAADMQFRGTPIPSERDARRAIEATCAQPLAAGFSLFGIFTRAATYGAPRR